MEDIAEKHGKTAVIPGMEPTGHYWFALGKFLQDSGMKPVHVNPHHVKKSKELDDNNPNKNDRKDPKTIDGVKVLDNISFILNREDKVALVGPNEQAKTVLFKILSASNL